METLIMLICIAQLLFNGSLGLLYIALNIKGRLSHE